MSSEKKLPEDRFVIRPDVDPTDEDAVNDLGGTIAAWVVAQRDRVQRQLREKKAAQSSQSNAPPPPIPMAAKSR